MENYELEKYGYGSNYERKDPYDTNNLNENKRINNNDYNDVDSYKKMYEEHMKKMQTDQVALNNQDYRTNSSNMRNAAEVILTKINGNYLFINI